MLKVWIEKMEVDIGAKAWKFPIEFPLCSLHVPYAFLSRSPFIPFVLPLSSIQVPFKFLLSFV